MIIINRSDQMHSQMQDWQSDKVVLVPTMGNLHMGHQQLIQHAQSLGTRTIVSIFVNPIQFNQASDYERYPRTIETDLNLLERLQVDAVFAPSETEIYPDGKSNPVSLPAMPLANEFCGHYRPGHFAGVCAVVARLFEIIPAHSAVFGEKDFQQLLIIQQLVETLSCPVHIAPVKTQRESDGLAYSSRNQHLTPEQRQTAPWLYKILTAARLNYTSNNSQAIQAESVKSLEKHGFKVEYFSLRDASDLTEINSETERIVILCAAWLGQTRLIDNVLFHKS